LFLHNFLITGQSATGYGTLFEFSPRRLSWRLDDRCRADADSNCTDTRLYSSIYFPYVYFMHHQTLHVLGYVLFIDTCLFI